MPVPVDDLITDEPFPVNPESVEYEVLSFLVTAHEYGFTPQEIAAQTGHSKATVSDTVAQLVENGLIKQTESIYYIEPWRVDKLTNRLRSLDAAVKLFEVTPTDDSYAESGWEQDVPSLELVEQTEISNKKSSPTVEARAEALVTEVEEHYPE